MSGENDPNGGSEGQQGGQPQGGQAPQGGQPQGGQAAPQGGQAPPQGGQAYGQGRQPVNQGPGLADKLQQPVVKSNLIDTISGHALIGLGTFIALLIIPELSDSGAGAAAGSTLSGAIGLVGIGAGFLLAVLFGRRAADTLDVEQNTLLAAGFVGNAVGYFVGGLLSVIGLDQADALGSATTGSGINTEVVSVGIGDYLLPLIVAMIFVGAIGAGAAYIRANY